jgi:hypothetical protein
MKYLLMFFMVFAFVGCFLKLKSSRRNYIVYRNHTGDTIYLQPPLFAKDDTIYIDSAYFKKLKQ